MAWLIEFDKHAAKEFDRLDSAVRERIMDFLDSLELSDNPRQHGKALKGNYKGAWRYRVGDYRLICNIQDDKLIVLVLDVGHRSKIYKK